jgi:hypothetical protein
MQDKRRFAFAGIMLLLVLSGGCAYAGVAASGDAAIITRNDHLLFGLLRKTYVCKITPAGLTQCASAESP